MSSNTPLGVGGFTFADLHQPARLRELYDRFAAHVKAVEPELWPQWSQYREVPESLSAIARGNIVVAMAPHVSRFVAELFSVAAFKASTSAPTLNRPSSRQNSWRSDSRAVSSGANRSLRPGAG